MQLIVLFVEIILIFFYFAWEDSNSFIHSFTKNETHYATNVMGISILQFPLDMEENEKLMIITKSELLEEVISYSPNAEIMAEIFTNGIEDQSDFKENFTNYIKCRHWQYIGGEITKDKFQEFISNPQNLNSCQ